MNVLVVVAVDAERDAVLAAAPDARVIAGGVGPAAAAAAAAAALSHGGVDLALSAGIGGGFAPLALCEIAVASASVFADLGLETPHGFVAVSDAGFGVNRYEVAPRLALELADATGGHVGTVLTVATVTGSAGSASELLRRWPDAVAEGMEGAGVAAAAAAHGVAFAEVRAISNAVGPRDRDAWDVPGALTALGAAVAAVLAGADWTP